MKANNPPTEYGRVTVDIGSDDKLDLIYYAAKNRKSVSDVVRKLIKEWIKKAK